MMIRTSKHNISKITNPLKLNLIDNLFIDYKNDLEIYLNYIIDDVLPLKVNLSSKQLPNECIKHSRYKQIIYKHASEIIRSQIDKSIKKRFKKYQIVYQYFKSNNKQSKFTKKKFSELNLKPIMKSKYFTNPKLKDISINLDERFFDIKDSKHFDNFIKITLPYFKEGIKRAKTIKVPLTGHKHSLNLKNTGFKLRNNIQIKKVNGTYYIFLIWEKEVLYRKEGKSLGIDIGYRRLIVTSDNEFIGEDMVRVYNGIVSKQRNSKEYKKKLLERDNLINYYVNTINLDNVKRLVIEDLCNVKHKSKFKNKVNDLMSRWTYRPLIQRLEMICEVKGIELVKVSSFYTSQTCSLCGFIHSENRKSDYFKCLKCGYEIDADYNAAINILNKGAIVPLSNQNNFNNI
jgi:putative transposase